MSRVVLSARQLQIVGLVATGATNKAIAHAMGISVSTVKNQITAILRKSGLGNRAAVAALAVRGGFAAADVDAPDGLRGLPAFPPDAWLAYFAAIEASIERLRGDLDAITAGLREARRLVELEAAS